MLEYLKLVIKNALLPTAGNIMAPLTKAIAGLDAKADAAAKLASAYEEKALTATVEAVSSARFADKLRSVIED